MLANRDLLLSQFSQGEHVSTDSSLYLLAAPNFFTIAQHLRHGDIPLWNPYVGFGVPCVSDLQAGVLSPWRWLAALSPTIQFYNLQLHLQVFFAALGGYVLGRFLSLGRLTALFVGLVFSLSPHFLCYLELLFGSYSVYPWLFLAFLRVAEKQTLTRICVASIATGLSIFSCHPLVAFTGIVSASILFLAFSQWVYYQPKHSVWKPLLSLTAVAVFSFLLATPLLLPFLENTQNVFCYKFNMVQPIAPWQTILYFLMHPGLGGNSPHLGVLAIPLLVSGCFISGDLRRKFFAIMVCALLIYVLMAAPGPLSTLMAATPLRFVSSTYYTYVFSFLLSLGIGFGAESVLRDGYKDRRKLISAIAALLLVLLVPIIVHVARVDMSKFTFDTQLNEACLQTKLWITGLVVGLLYAIAAFTSYLRKLPNRVSFVIVVIISLISELTVSRLSMPVTPIFDFFQTPVHRFLVDKGERVSPQGFSVLAANSNSVYGIRSLAVHNPMLLRRYVDFMGAASAHKDDFNVLIERAPISRLFDLASVKYIAALSAVVSDKDELFTAEDVRIKGTARLEEGISLDRVDLSFDSANRQVFGFIKWRCNSSDKERFSFVVDILDRSGNTRWYSGPLPCFESRRKPSRLNLSAFVPDSVKSGDYFKLGVRVFDAKQRRFLFLEQAGGKARKNELILAEWKNQRLQKSEQRFKILDFSQALPVRIFENTDSLPQAYMVNRILAVSDSSSVLNLLKKETERFRAEPVVEIDEVTLAPLVKEDKQLFGGVILPNQEQKKVIDALKHGSAAKPIKARSVERQGPNRVRIECENEEPSFLILTDMYYPGWEATVDGVVTPVYCANYAFRGVLMPPGKHFVQFDFRPGSFCVGVALAAFVFGAMLVVFLLELLGFTGKAS